MKKTLTENAVDFIGGMIEKNRSYARYDNQWFTL